MHLQCRLIAVEHELYSSDEEAKLGDYDSKQPLRRWETLIKHSKDAARLEVKRVAKLEELNKLLEEYREHIHSHSGDNLLPDIDDTILRQAQIAHLRGPTGRVLETFQDYIDGKAFGHDVQSTYPNDSMAPMRLISGRAKKIPGR